MMRYTRSAADKLKAQREALEAGSETFVWPCVIHGDQAVSDSNSGQCIECRALVVQAWHAKRDKAAEQLAEQHSKTPPKRSTRRPAVSPWKPRKIELDYLERVARADALVRRGRLDEREGERQFERDTGERSEKLDNL